jgi:uncharacterized damage-inducible protein DinB
VDLAQDWLNDARREFEKYRNMADRALAQAPESQWFTRLDAETNSIALVMKHMAGNMRSRWTDFLTTDGEKPDRDRDTEFEDAAGEDAASMRARWDAGWARLFATLDTLTPADLARTVTIRGEPHTVAQAIQRQLTHYAYHVGQIVLLARHAAGPAWTTLSIARGKSREYDVAKDGTPYLAGPGR